MFEMSRDQWWEFASAGTRTGKLAVVRANGAPNVVPIWFVLAERNGADHVVVTTGENSVKGRALRRDPRFSLCVDEEKPPFSFVTFTAEAEISTDLTEMRHWAARLGGRYMGEDTAEEFGQRNAVPGELLVFGRITHVVAQAELAA